ncbi:MAG: RnfABCDGE type electron transport complex subunit C [Oscillospiraceae bacterium]|nr:RnfABCDGE type electron transport complex subunit C [Oscillospiraceae bacterium]
MILNAVELPVYNDSAEKPTQTPHPPPKVIISLKQSAGNPCRPLVKVGDYVLTGQKIGDDDNGGLSVPVHASITGTVTGETAIHGITGELTRALIITADSDNVGKMHESVKPPIITDKASFLKAVRDSGSVGLGGAGFPTYKKLDFPVNSANPVNTLVINAAECEPYVTSDYREIIENPSGVIDGIELVMKYTGIPKAVIGIEKDKPRAVKILENLLKERGCQNITVKKLPLKYPQGAEKVLIYQVTGKKIKEGELPLNAGCVVLNVSTVSFLAEYVKTGIPLITRRVTLDGNIAANVRNFIVPVGTSLDELCKLAELRAEPDRIVVGGPMMGFCVYDTENTPVTKTTGAVLFFSNEEGYLKGESNIESACIRCGKCIHVCSLNLDPYEINRAFDAKNITLLEKLRVNLCMSCAACSFICPAKRNLCEKNQLAKILIRNEIQKGHG